MTPVSVDKVITSVAEPALNIVLTPDNPCNSTLIDEDTGEMLYTVSTHFKWSSRITEVKSGSGDLIATYTRNDILADTVRFADGKEETFTNWIKKSLIPLNNDLYWTHNGVKYKWKECAKGQSLELFYDDKSKDTSESLLAFAQSGAKVGPSTRVDHPAVLQLAAEIAMPEVRDEAVVAFLFLEARRRAEELSSDAFASAIGSGVNVGKWGTGM